MPTFGYYERLGVPRGASKDDIRKAYKKLAIQHHPDKGGDPEAFKEISNAYAVLTDDEKRPIYDQVGDEGYAQATGGGGGGGPGFHPNDIFAQMFGGFSPFGHPGPMEVRRRDVLHRIQISLADAFVGTHKTLKTSVKRKCFSCLTTCGSCQGRGMVQTFMQMGPFRQMVQKPCDACQGSGRTKAKKDTGAGAGACPRCGGQGEFSEDHRLEMALAPGVATGYQKVFQGLGEQAETPEEVPGNLVVEVVVLPHPQLKREGADLAYEGEIGFAESVLGRQVDVPHVDPAAPVVHVQTAAFGVVQPGQRYKVAGKGMPNGDRAHGDLWVSFRVRYPPQGPPEAQHAVLREAFAACGWC